MNGMRFDNKIVVVTGAASGIGKACAELLASLGGRVVVADRAFEVAQGVATAMGGHARFIDVAEDAGDTGVQAVADEIEKNIGPVDVLVNCAGVLQRTLPPGELTLKEWDKVIQIDLRGTYVCCAAFGVRMAARRQGAIVNVASVAGMGSGPLHGYGPAKAGVINLTECLAGEWGPSGVRVNAVSPGFTATPALERGFSTQTLERAALETHAALGRLVRAEEIAAGIAFLASDLASAVTGVNLVIDAGYRVATPWASYGGLRTPS